PQSPNPRESILVARAQTDWAFLEQASGRPAVIPSELKAAFFPEGAPEPVSGRDRFPPQPPLPTGVVKVRRRVEWRDIDPAQHVNNATYMAYMEDAGVQAALAHGWPVSRMVAEGFAIVARRYRIEYRQPAVLDDELEVVTWVSDVRRATAMRHYTIARPADGQLLARASAHWVWVNLQTGQPIRIPAHFRADFAPNISELPADYAD
ncbi:MAG: thioesterase family protein, partial [Chloroflexota bacterium]